MFTKKKSFIMDQESNFEQQQFFSYVQQTFQYVRRPIAQEHSYNILNGQILQINDLCFTLLRLLQWIVNNSITYIAVNGLLIEANELKEELISKINILHSELLSHNNLVSQLPSTVGRPSVGKWLSHINLYDKWLKWPVILKWAWSFYHSYTKL